MDLRALVGVIFVLLFVDTSQAAGQEENIAHYKIDGKVTIQGLKHSGEQKIPLSIICQLPTLIF